MDATVLDSALAEALSVQYPSMLSLDLRGNAIVAIRDLSALSRLRELRLDDNHLTELGGLQGLSLLTSLSARGNAIASVSETIATLSSLRLLDLARNQLNAGPWVGFLAKLPRLIDLDVRDNPVSQLEGSHQLLAAALPSLQHLNGLPLPAAVSAAPAGGEPQARAAGPAVQQPYLQLRADPTALTTEPTISGLGHASSATGADQAPARPTHLPWLSTASDSQPQLSEHAADGSWAYEVTSRPAWPHQQQQQEPAVGPPRQLGLGGSDGGRPQPDAQVLRWHLEAAEEAREKLLHQVRALQSERQMLERRAYTLEEALRKAESGSDHLQHQLAQQTSQALQQVTTLADQVTALTAERDAAARTADSLADQLAHAQAAAAEATQAAAALQQRLERLQEENSRQLQELRATQELLLKAQTAAREAAAGAAAAAAASVGKGNGQGGASSPGAGGPDGSRVVPLEQALQQRVAALQHIVRVQERELARLGGLRGAAGPPAVGDGAAGAAPGGPPGASGLEGLLQPWREQVQALHEQLGRVAAEGAEQRARWGQQVEEMREQFTQACTLMEVLEQRSREQRSENAQLHGRISRLSSELQQARQRAVHLEQQVAARDAAAQAVRRQLVAFVAQQDQQAAALESRAQQLGAFADRLRFACTRLGFVERLAAVRRRGGLRVGEAEMQTPWRPESRTSGSSSGLHVALNGILASSPAAVAAAAAAASRAAAGGPTSGPPGAPSSSLLLVRDGCSGGALPRGSDGPEPGDAPLVAALRQELSRMSRDREMLLQQLAQVTGNAEECIRQAQVAMQEREAMHREALVAARVEAAQRAAEAAAERRVQSAEAGASALVASVRQQMTAAVQAAEDACRRAEAAAGVRVSRALVRLQDIAKQVDLLQAAQQRAGQQLRSTAMERDRLQQELLRSEALQTELRSQLAKRGSEAHAQVAELQATHEEALAAERRRSIEAERLAAKAASECGQLERQLARMREAKAQQEDARLRRLQTQLHEQEGQLRSLRRERSTLLAVLRKHNLHVPPSDDPSAGSPRDVRETRPNHFTPGAPMCGGRGDPHVLVQEDVDHESDTGSRRGREGGPVPPRPLQLQLRQKGPSGSGPAAAAGGLISSIIRGAGVPRDTRLWRDGDGRESLDEPQESGFSPPAAVTGVGNLPTAAPGTEGHSGAGADTAQRLAELEALTAELLSM